MDGNSTVENLNNLNGTNHIIPLTSEPSTNTVKIANNYSANPLESEKLNHTSTSQFGIKEIPSDYVFGSNISSRVVNANTSQGALSNLWTVSCGDNVPVFASSSTSSVFTTLAKAINVPNSDKTTKNLEESAKEFIEDKRKDALSLVEVNVITGEEKDKPIIRQHCRAYVFDTDKQKWSSLGSVQFHLNDIPSENEIGSSRVVVRLASTRRLIINTLVWDTMPVVLVDPKSLRIGAISEDGKHVKSYLFVFPPDKSASRICQLLTIRKSKLETHTPLENQTPLSGQKHQLDVKSDETDSNSIGMKIFRNGNFSSSSGLISTPQTGLLRPSVLASSNHLKFSNNSAGEVYLRNSFLDAVVKKMQDNNVLKSEPKSNISDSSADINSSPSITNDQSLPTSITKNTTSSTIDVEDNFKVSVQENNISDRLLDYKSDFLSTNEENTDENNAIQCDRLTLDASSTLVTNLMYSSKYTSCNLSSLSQFSNGCLPNDETEMDKELPFKFNCHLYYFDRTKHKWNDCGSVCTYLIDFQSTTGEIDSQCGLDKSCLVIRNGSNWKLLANILIWSDLDVSIANDHSICLTTFCHHTDVTIEQESSMDSTNPLFCGFLLVMDFSTEADTLFEALKSRLNTLRRTWKRSHCNQELTKEPNNSTSV